MENHIPESEVSWLSSIDEDYKFKTETGFVYPVKLLPPSLARLVRCNTKEEIHYVNFGPSMGCSQGIQYYIWGWKELPRSSGRSNEDWSCSFVSVKPIDQLINIEQLRRVKEDITAAYERLINSS